MAAAEQSTLAAAREILPIIHKKHLPPTASPALLDNGQSVAAKHRAEQFLVVSTTKQGKRQAVKTCGASVSKLLRAAAAVV